MKFQNVHNFYIYESSIACHSIGTRTYIHRPKRERKLKDMPLPLTTLINYIYIYIYIYSLLDL